MSAEGLLLEQTAELNRRPARLQDPARPLFNRLGEQLIGANLISSEQLEKALGSQSEKGLKLGEALIEMGVTSEEHLLPFVERQLGVPAVRLREGLIDPLVISLLDRDVADSMHAIPLFRVHDKLCVALDEPQDLQKIDELERITRLKIRPIFAFRSSIDRMIPRCYEEGFEVDEVTADLGNDAVELQAESVDIDLDSVETLVEGSPIINLVNYFVVQGVRQRASDIHLEPDRKYSVVRFRVDGQLREVLRPRRDMHAALVSRIKVMAKLDIAEHRQSQDGRFQVTMEGRSVDFRVSTLPTVLGEKVVLRILDRQNLNFDLDKLGIPHNLLKNVKQLLAKPYGLLLVTGPTGSGKTTTLYSALELVKSVHRNIVTVEDPVEYQIDLVNQVQVDEARKTSFASALRSILRQDPDIIMIGEIRDRETANIAVQAALTGHLVLSTLHTNDSVSAVTRLMDMGLEPFKVAASLIGVLAQRLLRTTCPRCRTFYYPPRELLETIHYQGDQRRSFIRGEGCVDCYDSGFQGRTGIYEVMLVDQKMREMIGRKFDVDALRQCHQEGGGRSLLEEGIRLAEEQQTSLDEVMRVAYFE